MKRAKLTPRQIGMLAVGLGWFIAMGCNDGPTSRMNAPPQGFAENQNNLREHYIRMTDNALLADMSMSSAHFVPHQPELNGLGASRLNRYTSILKVYGGKLRYDGLEKDKQLKSDRLAKIKEYLVASGLDADRFTVAEAKAGGSGINATEAIEIRQATNFNPDELANSSANSASILGGGSN